MNETRIKRPSKRLALIITVATVLLIAAGVLVYVLTCPAPVSNAYVPPPRDGLAVPAGEIEGDIPTLKTEFYTVSLNPDMRVDGDGRCAVTFVNDAGNACHLMLDIRLKDSGLLIYRTGLVAPGEGIKEITFVPDALASMAQGTQAVILTVYSFAVDTYVNMGDIGLETALTYTP